MSSSCSWVTTLLNKDRIIYWLSLQAQIWITFKVLSNHSTRIALSNCSSVVRPVSLAWNIVFMTPITANVACFAGVIFLSVTTWKCHLCQVWHVKYVSHQECSHWYQFYQHWNELIVLVLNVVESQLCCQDPFLSMCSLQICSIKFKYIIIIMSSYLTLAMHSLAAESRHRLSETEPTCFFPETNLRSVSDIALNPSLHNNNVNKVNMCYCIVLIILASCSFPCTLSLYWQCNYLYSAMVDKTN